MFGYPQSQSNLYYNFYNFGVTKSINEIKTYFLKLPIKTIFKNRMVYIFMKIFFDRKKLKRSFLNFID